VLATTARKFQIDDARPDADLTNSQGEGQNANVSVQEVK